MKLSAIIIKRFSKNKLAVAGFCAILFLLLTALLAPFISPYDPTTIDIIYFHLRQKIIYSAQTNWEGMFFHE
jgi:ABC-type antimicrobial peptide transport system permease subunit